MTQIFKDLLLSSFSRRTAYRLGRALYQKARGDVANDMGSNGEWLVQHCVVTAWLTNASKECVQGRRLAVFDVGANVGAWSAAFVKLLWEFKISESTDLYMFEPVPSTFETLRRNLGGQAPNLHFEKVALSSENSDGAIYVHGQDAGTNSLHRESQSDGEMEVKIVKVTAADFCRARGLQNVQLLKCDTEGHDMEVIRGALPLLANGKISVLQFEYNHRWIYARHFLRDAFAAVEGLPYVLAKLQPDHLVVFAAWHPELERYFEGNYALVHVDALAWFPTRRARWDGYNTMRVERR